MKALTLTCPWAHAIAHWGKNIENRTWQPPRALFGERIAIHAGKSPFRPQKNGGVSCNDDVLDDLRETLAGIRVARFGADAEAAQPEPVTPRWLHERSSAILCTATVAGWVGIDGRAGGRPDGSPTYAALRTAIASPGPWFIGPYGWVLTDVVTLAEPVPCKGAQGLWTVPPEVLARLTPRRTP